jgi:hypoxanthine phosphoribosyltransferase
MDFNLISSFLIGVLSGLAAWALSIALMNWWEIRFTFARVQKMTEELATNLVSDGFRPDYVVAIDRNATILGTLLAGLLGLRTVVSVSTENKRLADGSRLTCVSDGYLCDVQALCGKKILVFIGFNNSGTSLETVYNRLVDACGGQSDIRTAAFYTSPSPRLMPQYLAVGTQSGTRSAVQMMDRMPWATKSWKRVLREERR